MDRFKITNELSSTYGMLTDEDTERMRKLSANLLSDPICNISTVEAKSFVLEAEEFDEDSLQGRLMWAWSGRTDGTNKLFQLTMERLENRKLQEALGVGSGFNQQLFWMFTHAWLLHKRMIVFDDRAQEEDYFNALFRVVDNWLMVKEIPRHRLSVEMQNAQRHALGFCVSLDVAIEQPDILGGRILDAIYNTFHEGQVPRDNPQLVLLTKYIIRQAAFALLIPRHNFLQGKFIWADMPLPLRQAQPKKNVFKQPRLFKH